MELIKRNGEISICFAVDENYVKSLKITIFSLLANRDKNYSYDINILTSKLTEKSKASIAALTQNESGVSIRFHDVSDEEKLFEKEAGSYLSVATFFRLLLFSEMFEDYEKVLYLDSDIIVEGDISKLYFESFAGSLVCAVEETGFRYLSYRKKAVFIDGSIPYNVDNYRTDALRMRYPKSYFNAGVMLIDLKGCREKFSFCEAVRILNGNKYHYNDQDVLNILFDGNVRLLDCEWNYQNNIDYFLAKRPEVYGPLYRELQRSEPKIIHFVSFAKPWDREVTLDDRYHYYEEECKRLIGDHI